jgi:hypothetical protein
MQEIKKQDKYELKVDSKYGKYMKLLIAALTALGLIGTGAHQAGSLQYSLK